MNRGVGNVRSAGKGCRVCVGDCHQVGIHRKSEVAALCWRRCSCCWISIFVVVIRCCLFPNIRVLRSLKSLGIVTLPMSLVDISHFLAFKIVCPFQKSVFCTKKGVHCIIVNCKKNQHF